MEPTRILVVAHRTAATPTVVEAVRQRAEAGPCRFLLLVPAAAHGLHRAIDPEDHGREEAEVMLDLAVPLLEDAAGGTVDAWIGSHEPLAAVEDALNRERFDEVIVSTLPTRFSRWLHADLPRKVAGLGVPVTTLTATGREVRAAAADR